MLPVPVGLDTEYPRRTQPAAPLAPLSWRQQRAAFVQRLRRGDRQAMADAVRTAERYVQVEFYIVGPSI
jgi:hypothetical protein